MRSPIIRRLDFDRRVDMQVLVGRELKAQRLLKRSLVPAPKPLVTSSQSQTRRKRSTPDPNLMS
jgi:hypothetical protein